MVMHTKGPWFTADWSNDFGGNMYTIECRSKEVLKEGRSSIWPDGIVKHRIASTEDGDFDDVTNMYNALLMAAAPDLLDALEFFLKEYAELAEECAVKKARAAIAKAKGETDVQPKP